MIMALSAGAARADVKVGDTKDACDKSHAVTFTGKAGKVSVKAGQTKTVDMPAPVRELTWFCGGSQEASSNDVPWDRVKLKRAGNGALRWTFFRLPPPKQPAGSSGSSPTHVAGDTADGCDGSKLVSFVGKSGEVKIPKSESRIVDLAKPVTELRWKCGADKERVANDTPFDQVRISRRMNGAIKWVFHLKTAAPDPAEVCSKVRATGRFTYKNEDGKWVPLARVQVKLMDEDFGPSDQQIAVGVTDKDGRFDLTGKAGDSSCVGAGCKRPDPYVEFVLYEAHRIDIRDPLGNTARSQSSTRPDTCGKIDFGTQRWGGAEINPILYAHGQEAYQRFTDLTGDKRVPGHDGLVEIEYPTVFINNTPYTTWHTIHWNFHGESKTNFPALHHEFGHRIRHAADGDVPHFNWDMTRFVYARNHGSRDITNEGFAFNEGWAKYYRSIRDDNLSTEWKHPEKGDNVEGHVAVMLAQLHVECGGLAKLWQTLRDTPGKIHSIDEFRTEFLRRNPGCKVAAPADPPAKERIGPAPEAAAIEKRIRGELAGIKTRRLGKRSAIRPHITLAGRDALEAFADRQLDRDQALHAATLAAYEKALATLVMPLEALGDGRYDKALAAAKQQLAKDVQAATLEHVRATKQDVAAARKAATGDSATYLDAIRTSYERAEKAPPALPKSFWPATTRAQ